MKSKILAASMAILSTLYAAAQTDSIPSFAKLLELSLEDLMNIKVVTASGYLQTTSEAPSTITVISAQQIAERGYEQLEDALRDIPGIDMIHINGYAPTLIYFRGMYGAENLRALLMVDGIVENNILGSNDMAGPAYSLHHIERIEIIWGPVSALYGANAFGGVINLITKKGKDIDGLHAEAGFGTFNTRFEKVSLGIRKSRFEFAAAGTLYSSDGPRFTNRDPNYSGSFVDKAYSFNTTLSYYANKSTTTLGYRTYNTPMGWGTYSNSPTMFLGLPSQGFLNQGVVGIVQRPYRGEKAGFENCYLRTLFLQNEFKPNDKLTLLGRVVYRETGHGKDSYLYITTDGNRLIRVMIASFSNRISGEFTANYAPAKNHRISAGVQFYQDNIEEGSRQSTIDLVNYWLVDGRDTVTNLNSTFLPRVYDIRNTFGSYVQYIVNTNLAGKTTFTLGARFDRNNYFDDAFSPRIAIVNQPTKNLTLKFQFGNAFRAPTNLEQYQTPPTSNFQIKNEKIRTYELNGIYTISKNIRVQVNGFRNELSDVIALGNLSGFNPDKNPGVVTVNGVEGILDMVLSKNLSSFLNVTFQDSKGKNLITGTSGRIPGVARIKGNVGFTAHVDDLFTVSLTGNGVGTRRSPRTDPYGPVKGYFLVNCVVSTGELFKSRVTASLNIHNLFNTKWMDPGFRTADGFVYSTVLEQPGINGLFKIGISF